MAPLRTMPIQRGCRWTEAVEPVSAVAQAHQELHSHHEQEQAADQSDSRTNPFGFQEGAKPRRQENDERKFNQDMADANPGAGMTVPLPGRHVSPP